jgi:hypothetical protein
MRLFIVIKRYISDFLKNNPNLKKEKNICLQIT